MVRWYDLLADVDDVAVAHSHSFLLELQCWSMSMLVGQSATLQLSYIRFVNLSQVLSSEIISPRLNPFRPGT